MSVVTFTKRIMYISNVLKGIFMYVLYKGCCSLIYQHFIHISILKSGKKKNELMWVMLTLKSLWRKIDIIKVYHSSQKCLSLYIQSHNTPMSVGHRGHFLCLSKQGRNLCNVVEILRKFNQTLDLFSGCSV